VCQKVGVQLGEAETRHATRRRRRAAFPNVVAVVVFDLGWGGTCRGKGKEGCDGRVLLRRLDGTTAGPTPARRRRPFRHRNLVALVAAGGGGLFVDLLRRRLLRDGGGDVVTDEVAQAAAAHHRCCCWW
jgi:hypothetical protein